MISWLVGFRLRFNSHAHISLQQNQIQIFLFFKKKPGDTPDTTLFGKTTKYCPRLLRISCKDITKLKGGAKLTEKLS